MIRDGSHRTPPRILQTLAVAAFSVLSVSGSSAQTAGIDVPPASGNNRFYSDIFVSQRPALSFNGFSCRADDSCGDGLGVEEVLERLLNADPGSDRAWIRDRLVALAVRDIESEPVTRQEIIENARTLQARGVLALLTTIAEANGIDALQYLGSSGVSAAGAVRRFLDALGVQDAYRIRKSINEDAVKWVAPLTDLARAVDLYLALEQAFAYFEDTGFLNSLPPLLSCTHKLDLLRLLAEETERLDDLGNLPVLFGIKRDEIQPGNWPMKVHVATAYAALTQQDTGPESCGGIGAYSFRHWLERGLESAGGPTDRNRSKHWNYQTDSGLRMFAEGAYYFHLTLSEVIPFWHAVRLNHLLGAHPDFQVQDPFRAAWFLNPLEWLVDTAAPGGETLPLDDGNRAYMAFAAAMSWDSTYGDPNVGRKLAWIAAERPAGMEPNPDLLALRLAIPTVRPRDAEEPPRAVGVVSSLDGPRTGEQALILRASSHDVSGREYHHFLALNGEYGDAILRGEGHEQPDQLQLLYYVDDVSILEDSGYDNASGIANSTWNHYADHNVMTIDDGFHAGEGGLAPPRPDLFAFRIVSEHAPAEFLGQRKSGRVSVLAGSVPLELGTGLDAHPAAEYERRVLFVNDPSDPFLIDVNRGRAFSEPLMFTVRYHLGGELGSVASGGYAWTSTRADGTALQTRVYVFAGTVPIIAGTGPDVVMERYREEETIDRLDVRSAAPTENFASIAFLNTRAAEHPDTPVVQLVPHSARRDVRIFSRTAGAGVRDLLLLDASPAPLSNIPARATVMLDGRMVELVLDVSSSVGYVRLARGSDGVWAEVNGYAFGMRAEATGVETPGAAPGKTEAVFEIHPNPVRDEARLTFSLPEPGPVGLSVYDLLGRSVSRLTDQVLEAGRHEFTWLPGAIANGTYVARLTTTSGARVKKFVLARQRH